jgi:hypothetical protein
MLNAVKILQKRELNRQEGAVCRWLSLLTFFTGMWKTNIRCSGNYWKSGMYSKKTIRIK